MPRVVVPAHAGVFSALGCVVAEVAYDHVQTFRRPLDGLTAAELDARFAPLVEAVRAPLLAEGHAARTPSTCGGASTSATSARTTSSRWPWTGDLDALRTGFHALHRRLYALRDGGRGGVREPPRPRRASRRRRRGCRSGPATGTRPAVRGARGVLPRDRAHRPAGVPARGPRRPSTRSRARPSSRIPWATTLVYPGQTGRPRPRRQPLDGGRLGPLDTARSRVRRGDMFTQSKSQPRSRSRSCATRSTRSRRR